MKGKVFAIHFHNYLLPFLLLCFLFFLVVFPQTNLLAAREGIALWGNNLVPTLLPFLIATELLRHTDLVQIFGRLLTKWMRPLFNVPGEAGFAFLMGMISGYPVGAKIISSFHKDGICTKEEAERMLPFCNNSGPLFIIATVGSGFYLDAQIGFLLLFTHILASLSVGILFGFFSRFHQKRSIATFEEPVRKNRLEDLALGECILNSVQTILMIGGFLLLFSVILSVLEQSHLLEVLRNFLTPLFTVLHIPTEFLTSFLNGLFELTTGLKGISNIFQKDMGINLVLSAFLLGFGGLCVLLQVYGIISKEKLSIKPYFWGKLLQGLLAAIYTFLILQTTCLFQFKI